MCQSCFSENQHSTYFVLLTAKPQNVPTWVPPPDSPQVKALFNAQSQGKFFQSHPWRDEAERTAKEHEFFERNIQTGFAVPYTFHVSDEMGDATCRNVQRAIRRYEEARARDKMPDRAHMELYQELVPIDKSGKEIDDEIPTKCC